LRTRTWVLVSLAVVVGFLTTGTTVGAEQATGPPPLKRTSDGVVGASIFSSEGWVLKHEAHTFDKT
jgi:hypothetical protein